MAMKLTTIMIRFMYLICTKSVALPKRRLPSIKVGTPLYVGALGQLYVVL